MSFDASRRTWLSPLVRTVTEVDRPAAPVLPGTPEFEPWLAAALAERGFALGHAREHLPKANVKTRWRSAAPVRSLRAEPGWPALDIPLGDLRGPFK